MSEHDPATAALPPCRIRLTNGLDALVDAADYEAMADYLWSPRWMQRGRYIYVVRPSGSNGEVVFMHRQILLAEPRERITFVNGNGLDVRRCNLKRTLIRTLSETRRLSLENNAKSITGKRQQRSIPYDD